MVKVELSGEIKRPVDEVFDYLTNPAKEPEWNSMALEANAEQPGPIRVGSRIHSVGRLLGRRFEHTNEVIELVPNEKYSTKSTSPFPVESTLTFEPTPGGTRVTFSAASQPGGFFKVAEPVLGRIVKKQLQAQFDTLKELLEARAPAKAGG
jgi:uncharacterized protein YndB with AHSA1/START domain